MSIKVLISILLLKFGFISSNFDDDYKLPLEGNHVVNKAIWVKNKPKGRLYEKPIAGDFIFRANSLDDDKLAQNIFDPFNYNDMQEAPAISSYFERSKRSNNDNKQDLENPMKNCKENPDCFQKHLIEQSNLILKLKPLSLLNDYPYEVAMTLGDNSFNEIDSNVKSTKNIEKENIIIDKKENKHDTDIVHNTTEVINEEIYSNDTQIVRQNINETKNELKNINFLEERSENASPKVDRSIFDNDEQVWHQRAPVVEPNIYKIAPKVEQQTKPVNEKGLIRIISMLTTTFKKIMKQHSEIKEIHGKLSNINDDVKRNVADLTKKFNDIEEKHAFIVSLADKINEAEARLTAKELNWYKKEQDLSSKLLEFENQQKKLLSQQRQFYNIQKFILAQNEKINVKQSLIAKTQSEISHRQNHFARIIAKIKQIHVDNKNNQMKLATTIFRPKPKEIIKVTHTTIQPTTTTESVKINLFSIPALNKLENQDSIILKEKEKETIDDLVYKYYFNNTFIDSIMKSKVLSNFYTASDSTDLTIDAKNESQKDNIKKAVEPIKNEDSINKIKRKKRWIRRTNRSKLKRKNRGKKDVVDHENITDAKPPRKDDKNKNDELTNLANVIHKSSPYVLMAKSFCNEIGQNKNDQILSWCIEKALRRLRSIDKKIPTSIPTPKQEVRNPKKEEKNMTVVLKSTTKVPSPTIKSSTTVTPSTEKTTTSMASDLAAFFPDNDELELRSYDLTPDTEGNVYYDGSLHASDLGVHSEDLSDILPGIDSNSRISLDPIFNLKAFRSSATRRLNLMKKQMKRPPHG